MKRTRQPLKMPPPLGWPPTPPAPRPLGRTAAAVVDGVAWALFVALACGPLFCGCGYEPRTEVERCLAACAGAGTAGPAFALFGIVSVETRAPDMECVRLMCVVPLATAGKGKP